MTTESPLLTEPKPPLTLPGPPLAEPERKPAPTPGPASAADTAPAVGPAAAVGPAPAAEPAAGCCPPVLRAPLTEARSAELSRLFKAIADPVRLRLLSLIACHAGGEACVCDLTGAFDLTGPTISHHLKVLREAGVIDGERRGTWIYYRVRRDAVAELAAVLDTP